MHVDVHKGGMLLPALIDMHHPSLTRYLSKVHSTTAMRLVSVMWPKVAGLYGRIFWSMWALHCARCAQSTSSEAPGLEAGAALFSKLCVCCDVAQTSMVLKMARSLV